MRPARNIVLMLLGGLIIAIGVVIAYDSWAYVAFFKRSPLAANLPDSADDASKEFSRRIWERFPLGSPVADLTNALTLQGFRQLDPEEFIIEVSDLYDPKRGKLSTGYLTLSRNRAIGIFCKRTWNVPWVADEDDRLLSTMPHFEGCFLDNKR